MTIKAIKTKSDYNLALSELELLIDLDPDYNSPKGDRLEVLSILITDYEVKNYPIDLPDPVEAIRFRMEQQNLSPRDLIPYLGSRSKVSEILSRKRYLTLSMIRSLHNGLGIPAKALLVEVEPSEQEGLSIEWSRFPITEMIKRGWIRVPIKGAKNRAENILRDYFAPLETPIPLLQGVLFRRSSHIRSARNMDNYALAAWSARVMMRALENPPSVNYQRNITDLDFMRSLAKLSATKQGPLLARDSLRKHGISLVVEPHLPRTYLDGAAIMYRLDHPVIGLSLRYDRIDNFWFVLMHELAHLSLHYGEEISHFYDDLDVDLDVEFLEDSSEKEADDLANEALIPQDAWIRSPASKLRSPEAAENLARNLQIHPAIVAGRMRHEFKAYRLLNNLVGHGEVRQLFPEVI